MKSVLLSALFVCALSASAEYRIGIIGCDTGHAAAFARIANVKKDPRVAGFRVTCAYKWGSRDIPSSLRRYDVYLPQILQMGVEMKDSIADVLKEVDFVLLETCDGRPHFEQALEVFKSGKPCFIDKPVAADLVDVVRIYDAGRKYNVPWFCTSALRFAKNAQEAGRGELGKVRGADLWSPSEVEPTQSRYYWYAIHAAEPLFTVMGTGCKSVTAASTATEDVLTGVWADGRIGTMRALDTKRPGDCYGGVAFTEKGAVEIGGYSGYERLFFSIVDFFRTGKAPVTPEETLEIYTFLSAAERSAKEGGRSVSLEETLKEARAQAVSEMKIDGFYRCTAAKPQKMLEKDGTVFTCGFKDGRFRFRFDVKDADVCVAETVKHPLDLANGDRVEVYFVPDAEMKKGYRCAEIDASGRVLSYSVDEKKKFDWFWKFATLESRAAKTADGYVVEGSVAVEELVSFGVDPKAFHLGVFRAEMSAPGKTAAWCSAAPLVLPAHFHQPAMLFPYAANGRSSR